MTRLSVALALLAAPGFTAPAFAETTQVAEVAALIDYHRAACSAQGGELDVAPDVVVEAHLFGPEDPAYILDSSKLSCSAAPTMFCGEGVGCEINVFVGPAQHSLIVLNWSLVPDDDRQLLEVTIAAALVRRAQDLTTRMTWDSTTSALVEVD